MGHYTNDVGEMKKRSTSISTCSGFCRSIRTPICRRSSAICAARWLAESAAGIEILLAGGYGHKVHVWDSLKRRHQQELDLGSEQQMVLELRPAHDPTRAWGFAGVVISLKDLSASVWLWYRENGKWAIKKVAEKQGKEANLQDYSTSTRQAIASCSKWLSAALVMTFVDEGKLNLTDTAGKFLPVLSQNGKGNTAAATPNVKRKKTKSGPCGLPIKCVIL